MAKLKVAEIFYSLQGEGLYLGTPSIFLRLFGCNFTCAGFGMPKGEKSEERLKIDPKKLKIKDYLIEGDERVAFKTEDGIELAYKKYEDLPLVHTGCDSYASWDPRFKHLSPMLEVEEVARRIVSLLPDRRFDLNKHLIITGGEPLLPGWQKVLPELLKILEEGANLENVTFETNGTQALTTGLDTYLRNSNLDVTFSCSSKLSASGEAWKEAIQPRVVEQYYWAGRLYFKWVVAKEVDVDEVRRAIAAYELPDAPVYLMPVGGTADGYFLNNKRVAEIAMANGWRYSPRLQVELWKNAWGT